MARANFHLGGHRDAVSQRLAAWEQDAYARRLWDRDPTLWSEEELPELTDRLGWLDLPAGMQGPWADLAAFGEEAAAAGTRLVMLLGMGGSSLAPEVLHETWGRIEGRPALRVLDSTHPEVVHEATRQADPATTLFVVSSKSGTTAETLSLFRHFWKQAADALDDPGSRFLAVTDPGSFLEELAGERGFRRIFHAPPDVGGRYSALTVFGLVPAALVGVDGAETLARASAMATACGPETQAAANPGLELGAVLGEMALAGRDKVTFLASPGLRSFPDWAEQLVAESLGKDGRGIVPVVGEPAAGPDACGEDRLFVLMALEGEEAGGLEETAASLRDAGHPLVEIVLEGKADLGAEFFRWEVATAAAGSVLGVHPFNQPDVELAKRLAREAMAEGGGGGEAGGAVVPAGEPAALGDALSSFLATAGPGDYIGLQAWLATDPEVDFALEKIRLLLREPGRLATTLGIGPRFLHSTGQLHKGGAPNGMFLQIVDDGRTDLPVPEEDYTFRQLMTAQAAGDAAALTQRERRLLRVSVGDDAAHGLARIVAALGG